MKEHARVQWVCIGARAVVLLCSGARSRTSQGGLPRDLHLARSLRLGFGRVLGHLDQRVAVDLLKRCPVSRGRGARVRHGERSRQ